MNSFKGKLLSFVSDLKVSSQDSEHIIKETVKLSLQIQDSIGSTKVRQICYHLGRLSEFTYFKEQYLDVSTYLHRRLWVAVVEKVTRGINPGIEPLLSDVEFCLSNLNESDIEKVKKIEINQKLNVDSITIDNKWRTGKTKERNLLEYGKSKTKRLGYLHQYDPGLSNEDFAQDLVCEALRTFNSYPRSKCRNESALGIPLDTRVRMYIERSLNNKVLSLKGYYDCETRRRVVSSRAPLYKDHNQHKKLSRKGNLLSVESRDAFDAVQHGLSKEIERIISEINFGKMDAKHGCQELRNFLPGQQLQQALPLYEKEVTNLFSKRALKPTDISFGRSGYVKHWIISRLSERGVDCSIMSDGDVKKAFCERVKPSYDIEPATTYESRERHSIIDECENTGIKKTYHANQKVVIKRYPSGVSGRRKNTNPCFTVAAFHDEVRAAILGHIKISDMNYHSTVQPLVRASNSSQDQVVDVPDQEECFKEFDTTNHHLGWENHHFIESVYRELDDQRIVKFIRIVQGEDNQEFEKWAEERRMNLLNFNTLVQSAKKYLSLTDKEFKEFRQNPVIQRLRDEIRE